MTFQHKKLPLGNSKTTLA